MTMYDGNTFLLSPKYQNFTEKKLDKWMEPAQKRGRGIMPTTIKVRKHIFYQNPRISTNNYITLYEKVMDHFCETGRRPHEL